MCATWLKRRASSATPTSDWLITAVGPPPWATSIFPDAMGVLKVWVNARIRLGDCAFETAASRWRAFGAAPIQQALDLAQARQQGVVDNRRQPKNFCRPACSCAATSTAPN